VQIKEMEMELLFIIMEEFMKDIGKMIYVMAKGLKYFQMEMFTKENIKMESIMEKVS